MRDVHAHIAKQSEYASIDHKRYEIIPKKFTVERVSEEGKGYLSFQRGEQREFKGRLATERFPGAGRVFFFPYFFQIDNNPETARFIEIKGYGQDGREMCLWTHCDGDILFGMFYKNAKKEFDILEKARSEGLKVPIPLFIGKIPREEWLRSGLRVVNFLSRNGKINIEELVSQDVGIAGLREKIEEVINDHPHNIPNVLSAFSQPYNAGVLGRAVVSPFRLGDPADKYELTEENKDIARQCGHTFSRLIDLGFLHLSPGTGNWTEAGELTDMADCYDLKKDRNLGEIIFSREKNVQQEFWSSLIGRYHAANLSPFFIEGMFGKKISLQEAANGVKERTFQKIKELRN